MGDRAVIAREGEEKGVYVHWAGDLLPALEQIVARDGVEKATDTLLAHHWSNVRPDATGRTLEHAELIEGYGNAYTDLDGAEPVCMDVSDFPAYFIGADGTVRSSDG